MWCTFACATNILKFPWSRELIPQIRTPHTHLSGHTHDYLLPNFLFIHIHCQGKFKCTALLAYWSTLIFIYPPVTVTFYWILLHQIVNWLPAWCYLLLFIPSSGCKFSATVLKRLYSLSNLHSGLPATNQLVQNIVILSRNSFFNSEQIITDNQF